MFFSPWFLWFALMIVHPFFFPLANRVLRISSELIGSAFSSGARSGSPYTEVLLRNTEHDRLCLEGASRSDRELGGCRKR